MNPFQTDVQKAVDILRDAGCTEIFLFGSVISGKTTAESDIDLAVRGCPPGKFFQLHGQLLRELSRPVDLTNLDRDDAFARYLEHEGDLLPIA